MSCLNKQFNCDDPIKFSDSNLNIDQKTDGLDTATCGLNGILECIAEQLSNLLGFKINIDINHFIVCNKKFWDKKERFRIDNKTVEKNVFVPRFNQIVINKFIECAESVGYNEDQINVTIDRIIQSARVVSWLFNSKRTRYPLQDIRDFKKGKPEPISFKILCDDTIQTYDTEFADNQNVECSKECTISAKIKFESDQIKKLDSYAFSDIPQLLCENGPIICSFALNEKFKPFYDKAIGSSDPNDAIYDWNDTTSVFKQYDNDENADPCSVFGHVVLLTGYECFPNKNNPTHYLFEFKDSFKYGENNNFRDGYFYIKVPIEIANPPLSPKVPWNIGESYGFNFRVYGVKIVLVESKNKTIQNLINSKCCEKWYCIEQIGFDGNFIKSCVKKSIFDPTVSELIGYDNEQQCETNCVETPTETPTESSTETPTEFPTETPS
jgi:hypothetical protein